MKKYLPHLCVLAAGTLWGFTGLFNRNLAANGLYSIIGKYALAIYKPMTVTYCTFVCAGLCSLIFIRPKEIIECFSVSKNIWLALGLIVFCVILPYIFYTLGLSKLQSSQAAVISSIEPVAAAIVGVIAFNDPMNIMIVLGLICILISVYILR